MVALVYDHFQADEYNGEMFVAGRYTEKNGCSFFEVVGITRYGENELYYFIDCGNCDQDMYEDSSAILNHYDALENRAVFSSKEKAEAFAEELRIINRSDVENLDCDPMEYVVNEWEVI